MGEPPKRIVSKWSVPKKGVEAFLFGAPLYAQFEFTELELEIICGRSKPPTILDGYCKNCMRETSFTIDTIFVPADQDLKKRHAFDRLTITCVRNAHHQVQFNLYIINTLIQKVGQYPSLADVAISEARQKYKTVLRGENWGELYKAIGLAAHGEGIGSFVYLRRVFERLIHSRFEEFKTSEQWDQTRFGSLRMDEKIELLKGHLPRSLVENRKIYKIFSMGIHQLDNDKCLGFFEVGKRSILMILEDDLKTQQELADRKQLAEAVAKFGNEGNPAAPASAEIGASAQPDKQ